MKKLWHNPRWLILGSVLSLTFVAGVVKHTRGTVGLAEIIFFRCIISVLITGTYLFVRRVTLWPRRPWIVGARSVMGSLGLWCYFYDIGELPFGDANMLGYAYPVFVPILAILVLGEKLRCEVALLILVSLVGMGLILRPQFAIANFAALVGILGSMATAVDIVLVGYLGDGEPALRLVFWFMAICSLGAAPFLDWNFSTMTFSVMAWLVAAGIFGTISQILATRGFAMGDVSVSVVLVYTGVVMAFMAGVIIWGEKPTWTSVVGSLLVMAACARIMLIRYRDEIPAPPGQLV